MIKTRTSIKRILTMFAAVLCYSALAINAEVKSICGKPTLMLDGKKHSTMMMITCNPIMLSCIKNSTLDVNSPDAGSVWRIFSKKKLPAEVTVEADLMMKSPKGPDAGALLRFRRCGGEFLVGLNSYGKRRMIKITGSRVGSTKGRFNHTTPFNWQLDKYYRLRVKFKGKKLTVELDQTPFKKEITLPKQSTPGILGLTSFRCNAVYRSVRVINSNGTVIMQENWNNKKLKNWQNTGDFESLVKCSKAGIDIFQVEMDSSGCLKGPEQYDFKIFKQRCEEVLKQNPKAKIIVRMRLDLPMWRRNTSAKVTNRNIYGKQTNRYPWSFSDPEWKEILKKYVSAAVKYIDEHQFGKKVIGFLLMSGNGGEFVYHFTNKDFSDYSEAHRQAFIRYLKNKYSNDLANLNKAWKTKLQSFKDIQIPSPRERVHFSSWKNFGYKTAKNQFPATGHGQTTFFPTAVKPRMNDFLRFHSLNIVDFIKVQIKSIKKSCKQKRIVGVYYGYVVPAKSNVFNKGHNALAELLKSPDIDFIASPYGYLDRFAGGSAVMQLPCASARVNGKLAIMEDDTRTVFCVPHESMNMREKTLDDTIGVLKRNFAKAMQNNAGLWFLDFGSKWFSPAPLPRLISKMKKIYNKDLSKLNKARKVEIVVLLSGKSYDFMYRTSDLVKTLVNKQITNGLSRMGAPFDVALVSDIAKLDKYKLYIFLNTFYLNESEREAINSTVKGNQKTAIWLYAPGYISKNGMSAKNMTDLTGINLNVQKINAKLELVSPQAEYKMPVKIAPVIWAEDSKVKGLGKMELSGINDDFGKAVKGKQTRPGIVKKKFENWTSIYCPVPNIPYKVLNKLVKDSGVHAYNNDGNIITAGSWWLSIHATSNGKTTITLPKYNKRIQEVFTGKIQNVNGKKFVIPVKKGETYFWHIPNM